MKATYAGHSAVFLESGGSVLAIDPFLEGNPVCPDSLKHPSKLDWIVLTHAHGDHAGDAVRLHKETGAKVAAIFELANILGQEGVSESGLVYLGKGGTATLGLFSVTLTHAVHSSSYDSPTRGTLYAGEPCGVVVRDSETTVYHAGDTALFSDLKLVGDRWRPTTAFLPMGGCFTMDAVDAAEAAKLLRVKRAIPIHFKTFPPLAQTSEPFAHACAQHGITVLELEPGESVELG